MFIIAVMLMAGPINLSCVNILDTRTLMDEIAELRQSLNHATLCVVIYAEEEFSGRSPFYTLIQ